MKLGFTNSLPHTVAALKWWGVVSIFLIGAILARPDAAQAATLSYFDSSSYKIFGTASRDDLVYLQPATFTSVGRLPGFDSSLGTLTGISIDVYMRLNYNIVSHCNAPFCYFTSSTRFSDGFYSTPPGTEDALSGAGILLGANLNLPSCGLLETTCQRSTRGLREYSKTVDVSSAYFDNYRDTPVGFSRNGDLYPSYSVEHSGVFPGGSQMYLETCIDNCGDTIGALSLAAYIANLNHLLYNDTHYEFDGIRQFKINYEYAPVLSAVPLPASLPLFGAGLAVLGWVRGRRQRG